MLYSLEILAFATFGLLWLYCTRCRRSIANLPGPPSGSWFVGSRPGYEHAEEAGGAQFEWTKTYGNAFRVKGCFGEDVLFLSDPKALHYILNKSGYNFPRSWEIRVATVLVAGRGLAFVDGAQHTRQRRIMNPAFSHSALKDFLPLFFELSRRTTTAWTTMIRKQNTETSTLDVSSLLARTTLDIIGKAAFNYNFNSIEDTEPKTELHKAYRNLFVDTNYMISDFEVIFRRILGYMPFWVSDILTSLPKRDLQRLNNYMKIARQVAKDLVDEQMRIDGSSKEGGKDVMSIFVKANNSEDPRRRLGEDEILPQITTLLLAGHETTASSLVWVLYELSKHPEVQQKLRDEVKSVRAGSACRGSEMTMSDLESMAYTIAVIKETLRYHPIVPHLFRQAGQDDIIPVDNPLRTASGDSITAIPVRRGQVVQLGLASYNRLASIWGKDADVWRPERFLEEPTNDQKITLGVFGNLSTFSSGLRSCIGWRFAMTEMQIVLIHLIDSFCFSPVPRVEIKRAPSGIMQSMVKGQEHEGVQMPLTVSIIPECNADPD